VTVGQLEASNRILNPASIQPGQVLHTPAKGILHLVKAGQTLADIAATYAVPLKEIVSLNGIADPSVIRAGEELVIPPSVVSPWASVMHLSKGAESRFIWPLLGDVVSPFGWRTHPVLGYRHEHNGIDIDVQDGTTVHAAAYGRVVFTGDQEGYGTYVAIEHEDGYVTGYGHLSKVLVRKGQFVEAGQAIALSGNSGISSGPHLHFELRNGTFSIDPARYLP
jgi:LysM repeat protein